MTNWCRTEQPATAEMNSRYKWPMSLMPLKWTVESVPEEFSDDEYVSIIRNSFAVWEAVCGLQVVRADRTSRPNLVFSTRQIDRQNGVLAEAQLPAGNMNRNSTLMMWMDLGEHWANYSGGLNGRFMDVTRVMIHEMGHWWGITHITRARAIMNPSVSDVRSLLGPDIREAQDRMGEPKPQQPDTPGIPGGDCLDKIFKPEFLKAIRMGMALWERYSKQET